MNHYIVRVGQRYADPAGYYVLDPKRAFHYRNLEWALLCVRMIGGEVEMVWRP